MDHGGDDRHDDSQARRVSLETTLRGVPTNPELEYFIEKRAGQLDSVVTGSARCTVVIQPRPGEVDARRYEVDVRVVGEKNYAHTAHVDPDPLLAVRDAFDTIRHRLARQRSGVEMPSAAPGPDTETGTED